MAANPLYELQGFSHTTAISKVKLQWFHYSLFIIHIWNHKIYILPFEVGRVLSIITAKSLVICHHDYKKLKQLSQKQIFLFADMAACLFW